MPNLHCPDELVLWDFAQGELSAQQEAATDAHCRFCTFCAQTLDEIRKIDPVSNPDGARAQYEAFLAKIQIATHAKTHPT